jgi:Sec-independent protein translocase protein TatA
MALAGEPKKLEKALKSMGKGSADIKSLMKTAVKHTGNEKFVRGKDFKN